MSDRDSILRRRFPYVASQDVNRPVTVHWFDVVKAIEEALADRAQPDAEEGGRIADVCRAAGLHPLYSAPQGTTREGDDEIDPPIAGSLERLCEDQAAAFTRLAKSVLAAIDTGRSEPLFIVRDQLRNYIEDQEGDALSAAKEVG